MYFKIKPIKTHFKKKKKKKKKRKNRFFLDLFTVFTRLYKHFSRKIIFNIAFACRYLRQYIQ